MAGFALPNVTAQLKSKIEEKVDYSNLPCPKPYEDIHLEATSWVLHTQESLSLSWVSEL